MRFVERYVEENIYIKKDPFIAISARVRSFFMCAYFLYDQ